MKALRTSLVPVFITFFLLSPPSSVHGQEIIIPITEAQTIHTSQVYDPLLDAFLSIGHTPQYCPPFSPWDTTHHGCYEDTSWVIMRFLLENTNVADMTLHLYQAGTYTPDGFELSVFRVDPLADSDILLATYSPTSDGGWQNIPLPASLFDAASTVTISLAETGEDNPTRTFCPIVEETEECFDKQPYISLDSATTSHPDNSPTFPPDETQEDFSAYQDRAPEKSTPGNRQLLPYSESTPIPQTAPPAPPASTSNVLGATTKTSTSTRDNHSIQKTCTIFLFPQKNTYTLLPCSPPPPEVTSITNEGTDTSHQFTVKIRGTYSPSIRFKLVTYRCKPRSLFDPQTWFSCKDEKSKISYRTIFMRSSVVGFISDMHSDVISSKKTLSTASSFDIELLTSKDPTDRKLTLYC